MSEMPATKELSGDILSPSSQHSEVPLGTTTDKDASSTNDTM